MQEKETVVMSVGGSLIVPDTIDTKFLTNLKNLIENEIANKGRHFIIIAGGGRTARNYQEAAGAVTELDPDDLDWMGIHATRLNGHLLRTIFRDIAHPEMLTNPNDIVTIDTEAKLVVASGYRPGASTDLIAVQIAKLRGATKLINLSNIDHVYRADPKKDLQAEKIEDISWTDFKKLIPNEWDPGLSSPFDPVAAREAEAESIEVAIINGNKLDELHHYLNDESFVGTRIHS